MTKSLQRIRWKLTHTITALHTLNWRRDGWLFLAMLSLAVITPILMRQRLVWVSHWLTPLATPSSKREKIEQEQVERLLACMTLLMTIGRPLIQPLCLTRGVTLYHFLRRAGLAVELHFGVQITEGKFAGHCWLMLDGKPFAEPEATVADFTAIYYLPLAT